MRTFSVLATLFRFPYFVYDFYHYEAFETILMTTNELFPTVLFRTVYFYTHHLSSPAFCIEKKHKYRISSIRQNNLVLRGCNKVVPTRNAILAAG